MLAALPNSRERHGGPAKGSDGPLGSPRAGAQAGEGDKTPRRALGTPPRPRSKCPAFAGTAGNAPRKAWCGLAGRFKGVQACRDLTAFCGRGGMLVSEQMP